MNFKNTSPFVIFTLLVLFPFITIAQTGIIKGTVTEAVNNQPIPFATVVIDGTTIGVTTDIDGNYELTGLEPKLYNISASFLGFKTLGKQEVQVSNSKPAIIDFALEEDVENIKEVVVKANPFSKTEESPLSLQTIGTAEIQRNPGGNRDISKVLRSLPGVTSASSFRNDLLIRGGGPSENRFYLDDIEIPNINHFATQGSSGGPNGLINVDFIREVDFFSGAFPANRGNSMSSVLNFKQKDGRDDRLGFTFTVGSSDLAATLEGPIGKKTTFLFSIRQSYLQFLFQVLKLPFLPIYNDFQFKVRTKFDTKNELYVVGLGACDRFKLNLGANETEIQRYQLNRLPVYFQWNYTLGVVYKHYMENGTFTAVLSRTMLNNEIYKHVDNDESQKRIIDYSSQEAENKLRLEHKISLPHNISFNYGVSYEYARYANLTKINATTYSEVRTELPLHKYALFAQVAKTFFSNRLSLSTGLRMDGNNYNNDMLNPLNQISPRFSVSFAILPELTISANTGLYYQLPSYTTLGYQENDVFVNKDRLKYTRSFHVMAGLAYTLKASNTKFSLEGYYKAYENYPFLLNEQVSLANFGTDFGVIGDAPIASNGKGRTYGMELLVQQRLYEGFYGIMAYTLGWSEFTIGNGEYLPSAWDCRHIINLTLGKSFNIMNKDIRAKQNEKRLAAGKKEITRKLTNQTLEIGTNLRLQSGLPYTPFDTTQSALVTSWDRFRQARLDYNQLNAERLGVNYSIDLRLDYKWFFPKWSLNLYLDLQNIPGVITQSSVLILDEDANGNAQITNPGTPSASYLLKEIPAAKGTIVPTLGIIVQY